jgi:hypothetical protein
MYFLTKKWVDKLYIRGYNKFMILVIIQLTTYDLPIRYNFLLGTSMNLTDVL